MALTLTQIDFNRPPEQWGGELYELLVAAASEINRLASELEDVNNKLGLYENYFKKLGKEINKL